MAERKHGGEKPRRDGDLVYGFHAVDSLIKHSASRVTEGCLSRERQDKRIRQIAARLEQAGIALQWKSRRALDELCGTDSHQGIAVKVRAKQASKQDLEQAIGTLSANALVLILDRIQDPHNLGACLRTAECAGVDMVVLPKDGCSPVNQTVSKVASGAVESIKIIQVANLTRAIQHLKDAGFWIYGASDQGDTGLYQCQFTSRTAVVMGAEGDGMKRIVREQCDYLVSIPMAGTVSSLNVSVATGVMLFEFNRQQQALAGR